MERNHGQKNRSGVCKGVMYFMITLVLCDGVESVMNFKSDKGKPGFEFQFYHCLAVCFWES